MSYRERARRRFIRRWSPWYGHADAVRIWNGEDVRVERSLVGGPTRVSVRPSGTDEPWQELRGVTDFEFTEAPRPDRATGIRTMLRSLLAGRHRP